MDAQVQRRCHPHRALLEFSEGKPLGASNRWWTEADKPWSFLAWCYEWTEASFNPGYVSHMPIALDGTCNGLQHYAAMLRDEIGGKAVNPRPRRQAERRLRGRRPVVRDKLRPDFMVNDTSPLSWIYDRLHQLNIDRSITKRPVMVLPYGGTYKVDLPRVADESVAPSQR